MTATTFTTMFQQMIQIGEGVFKTTASTYEKIVGNFVLHCKKKWKINGACEDNLVDWMGDEDDYFKRMFFKCDGCNYMIRIWDSKIHPNTNITLYYGLFEVKEEVEGEWRKGNDGKYKLYPIPPLCTSDSSPQPNDPSAPQHPSAPPAVSQTSS